MTKQIFSTQLKIITICFIVQGINCKNTTETIQKQLFQSLEENQRLSKDHRECFHNLTESQQNFQQTQEKLSSCEHQMTVQQQNQKSHSTRTNSKTCFTANNHHNKTFLANTKQPSSLQITSLIDQLSGHQNDIDFYRSNLKEIAQQIERLEKEKTKHQRALSKKERIVLNLPPDSEQLAKEQKKYTEAAKSYLSISEAYTKIVGKYIDLKKTEESSWIKYKSSIENLKDFSIKLFNSCEIKKGST